MTTATKNRVPDPVFGELIAESPVNRPARHQAPRRNFWEGLSTATVDDSAERVHARELLTMGDLDWDVEIKPTYRYVNENGRPKQVKANDLSVQRVDGDQDQLGTVRTRYQPFQNREVFAFGDKIVDDHKGRWIATGQQNRGARVFMVMELEGEFDAAHGDPHKMYVVFRTSHDGSRALRADLTPIRQFCFNQDQLITATSKAYWSIRHTTNAKLQEVEAAKTLQLAELYIEDYTANVAKLRNLAIDPERGKKVLAVSIDAKRAKRDDVIADAFNNWMVSPTIDDAERETGWGLLNGVTEYLDHIIRRDNANSTFEAAMTGEGAATRNRVYRNLLRLAA